MRVVVLDGQRRQIGDPWASQAHRSVVVASLGIRVAGPLLSTGGGPVSKRAGFWSIGGGRVGYCEQWHLIMLEVGENEDLGWDAVGERKRDAPPTLHRADPRPESGSPGRGGGGLQPHTRVTHSRGGITAEAARLFSEDKAQAHRVRRPHAAVPRVTRSPGSRTR